MKYLVTLLFASSALMVACKKSDNPAPPPAATASRQDLLKDSVYLYSKEVYLWNDLIPAYQTFNPRQYSGSTDLQIAQNVMGAIKSLQPLDRFSMVLSREASQGLQTGEDKDYGFMVKAASVDKADPIDSVFWFVNYVYNQSTAGQYGVQRGWQLNKINGSTLGYNQPSVDILNNTLFGTGTGASFEFKKPDGTTATANLNKSSFVSNSVLHRSVIDQGGKKVGYLVFNQFFGAPSRTEIGQAFAEFQSSGITELVVDLRYNPGGSVETQDTLANLIAPLAANNQKMYTYVFNSTLQNNQHQLIRKRLGYTNMFSAAANTETFKKAGTLNLSRVFFIVGSGSASASELLINNLKPYMNVYLIGEKTYGKPVGFFPIPVYDVDIYPISFKTVNSRGEDNYYNGFTPDKPAPDGVNRNWGDVNEPNLAAALRFISSGSFGRFSEADDVRLKAASKTSAYNKVLMEKRFSGMFIEQ